MRRPLRETIEAKPVSGQTCPIEPAEGSASDEEKKGCWPDHPAVRTIPSQCPWLVIRSRDHNRGTPAGSPLGSRRN